MGAHPYVICPPKTGHICRVSVSINDENRIMIRVSDPTVQSSYTKIVPSNDPNPDPQVILQDVSSQVLGNGYQM